MTRAAAIAGLLAVLSAGAPARAQAPPPPPSDGEADDAAAREALRFARTRYESGSTSESAEAARAVLEDEPAHPEALEILARSLEAAGDEAAAEEELRALLARAPEPMTATATVLLAENLAARGLLERAIPLFESAEAAQGHEVRAGAGLARALLESDRRDEAARVLRRVFAHYRGRPDETLGARELQALARAALTAEKVPSLAKEHVRSFAIDARDFFQRSWKLDPEQTDLLVEWARIYLEKWDLVEARRLAKKALERNPRHARAHALLAEAALMDPFGGTKKYAEAREAIEAALGSNPRLAEAHVLRAELLKMDMLHDEALESAARALESRPGLVRALVVRAAILHSRGERAGAAEIERAALARGRLAGAEFLWRRAALLDSKFRYHEAHAYALRAVEVDPECWPAYSQLGFAAMRVGDEETARRYLDKAHEADPFDLFTYNQLKLLDVLDRDFETFRTERFVLRLHRSEVAALRPYLEELLDRAWAELGARYGVELDTPILVEVFPNLNDFSVRAVAHRFIPASGVTFARVVGLASPAAFPPGAHGFGRVLWHELAHVATLERSGYRVPRWLTEGIAVFEESKGHPAWVREWDVDLVDALDRGRLLPILELNQGFSRPRFPNQVMLSYYQGGLICQFIERTWGFPAILALLDGCREEIKPREILRRALGGISAEEFDRRFLAFAREALGEVPWRAPCEDAATLARLRREAKERPADAEALARYALAAADMRRYADAEAAAARLRALDPHSGDARLVAALVARHRRQFGEVPKLAAEARAAGTRDPLLAEILSAEHWSWRDPATKQRRDLRKAIAAWESAHALFPRHPGFVAQLVELYKEAEEEAKRRAMLEKLALLQPNNLAARAELADLAARAGEPKAAARWLEEILWLDPRSPELHFRLAGARLRLGDLGGAREEVERGLALAPGSEEALALAAEIERARAAAAPDGPGAPGADGPPTGTAAPLPPTGTATPAAPTGTAAPDPGEWR